MRGLSSVVAFAFLTALLAGCAQQGPGGSDSSSADPSVDVKPTETTGIIKGVVVDLGIKPIPQALVSVKAAGKVLTNMTNANGGFGFEGLEPGTYFVSASKLGYAGSQTSVEVVANEADVPTVRITLEPDGSYVKPYVNVQKHVGFIECTTSVIVLCGAPNLLTGQQITPDAFTWDTFFADNASLIQSELSWESSQAASTELFFQNELLNDGCDDVDNVLANETAGPSPLMTRLWENRIARNEVGSKCSIYYSVFSGATTGTPCVPSPVGDVCVGVTVEQKFEAYLLDFHGFYPPKDYLFVRDGPIKPPT